MKYLFFILMFQCFTYSLYSSNPEIIEINFDSTKISKYELEADKIYQIEIKDLPSNML